MVAQKLQKKIKPKNIKKNKKNKVIIIIKEIKKIRLPKSIGTLFWINQSLKTLRRL